MSRKPRVVIATRLFTPEVGAGAFRLQALADGLTDGGALVRVATTRPPESAVGAADRPGVRVERFPVLRDAGGNVRGYVQYLSFDVPLFFRLLLRRADIVVSEPPPTTGLMVAITSWLHRRPFVYYAADVWTDALIALSASRPLIATMRMVEGFVMRRAAAVISVSDEVAARVEAFGVPAERITVVGNGVNTDIFTVDGPAEESAGPYFVYTGTMSEWQGADVFVEAMPLVLERFPDARLQFFGQGADESHLKKTAARLGLESVSFGGIIPPDQAARWLRGATAALASIKPGLGYDFAKPTKIYAAAACGTPVVFVGSGAGARLVADNGLGYRADYDALAVAAAMCRAVDEQAHGTTAELRRERSAWVAEHASVAATGQKAASVVLGLMRESKEARVTTTRTDATVNAEDRER